jgi:flagellar basal body rod protein FlgC
MITTQTAAYCRRYATLACTIAREVFVLGHPLDTYTNDHAKRMKKLANDLAMQSGYIDALSLDPAIEIDDWRSAQRLWNDMVTAFTRSCDMNTRDRIKTHMDGFWDTV